MLPFVVRDIRQKLFFKLIVNLYVLLYKYYMIKSKLLNRYGKTG